DIAGGTLDITPMQQILGHKATVNVAVTLEALVEVEESTDKQFHIVSEDQNTSIGGTYAETLRHTDLPLLRLILKAIWNENLPALKIKTKAKSPAGAGLGGSSCL